MNPAQIVGAFVPFVVFDVATRLIDVAVAAALAGVLALVSLVSSTRARRGFPLLQVTSILAFAAIVIIAVLATTTRHVLAGYAPPLVTLLLAAVILASRQYAPFSAAFARASVPEQAWHAPSFIATNQRISGAWGVALTAGGLSSLLGQALRASAAPPGPVILLGLTWVLPLLAYVRAVRYTTSTAAAAHERTPAWTRPSPRDSGS